MKGLLIKDFRVLLLQKRFLIVMLAITAFMAVSMGDLNFVVGYLTILSAMLTIGTISYDDYDNGFAFLFTLPVTRKDYVLSKYVLCTLVCTGVWLLSHIVIFAGKISEGVSVVRSDILGAVCILVVCLFMLSVMIPLQMKFGAEKARVILVAVTGTLFAIGYLLGSSIKALPQSVTKSLAVIESIGEAGLTVIIALAGIAAMLISLFVSVRIMAKKQL